MYVYEDQYGWSLQPKTNSKVSYTRFWNDFRRTYKTRQEANDRMMEIYRELELI